MDLTSYEEMEYYLSHDILNKNFCANGFGMRMNDSHLSMFTDKRAKTLKRLMETSAVVRSRDNRSGYAAIIVKALIMDKDKKTIYFVDEHINTDKDKISILGGHAEPNELFSGHTTPIQAYLKSELVREMCEELTCYGYNNYIVMSIKEKCDVVGTMAELGLRVVEENTWYCYYSDTSFTIYIPYTITDYGRTDDSLNGAMIAYPYTQHRSMQSLLADGRHGRSVAEYLFGVRRSDIRVTNPGYLDAIFNTLLGK